MEKDEGIKTAKRTNEMEFYGGLRVKGREEDRGENKI